MAKYSIVYLLPITYTTHVSILVKPWTDNAGSYNASQMGISWTYSSSTYIGAQSTRIQVGSKNKPQTSNWTIQTPVSCFGSNKKITAIAIIIIFELIQMLKIFFKVQGDF